MKTLHYFLMICLLFSACGNDQQDPCNNDQEQETPFHYGDVYPESLGYMNMPRPYDAYNYPVYPGMEEWAEFNTTQEMLDGCQIPTCTLDRMSTQAVIQAIYEHPLSDNPLMRSNFQLDFEFLFLSNNAYMALVNRSDAGPALFERLVLVNPLTLWDRFESQTLELLISQPVFIAQLDDGQKKKMVKTAIEHDNLRQKNPEWLADYFYTVGRLRPITWLLVGRTMFAAGYTPFVAAVKRNEQLKSFLEGRNWDTYDELFYGDIPQQIVEFSESYLIFERIKFPL